MSNFSRLTGSLAAALVLAGPGAAQTVVYAGGSPNGEAGYDAFNDFRPADDFQLSESTSFNTLRFWGILPDGVNPAPQPSWQIMSDGGGIPGSVVTGGVSTAVAMPRSSLGNGFTSWSFEAYVGEQSLDAGSYWLALHDDIADSGLIWETTGEGAGNGFAVEFVPFAEWTAPWPGDLALQLERSDVVYDGGAPNWNVGLDAFNDIRPADDFELTDPLTFDALRFWGLLPAGGSLGSDIWWQILSDNAGAPGEVVAEGSAAAAGTLRGALGETGFESWQFDLALGTQTLGAGVYWLALHDGLNGEITDSSLLWETTLGGYGSGFVQGFLDEWSGPWDGNLAFQLRSEGSEPNVIPEPLSLLLLGTGLAGTAAAARRRRSGART